eukprot:323091_1
MAEPLTSPVSSLSSAKILPPTANRANTRITWWDRYSNASSFAKIFLLSSTIHAFGLVLVGIVSLAWPDVDDVYGALSAYVGICFFWFMLQGVLKENTLQLTFSILSAILVTIYLIWFFILDDSHIIVAYMGFGSTVFSVTYIALAPCLIKNFGWYRYNKAQTTNKQTMDMYYVYQKFEGFVLLDVEVCIIFAILVTDRLHHHLMGYIGNLSCIFFEIGWSAIGIRAVRTEHVLMTQCFLSCTFLLTAFIVINCYWISTDKQYADNTSTAQFFVMSAIALIVRAICMFWTFRGMKNFEKGLRVFFNDGGHYKDFWGG